MKIFLDTNILISSFVFGGKVAFLLKNLLNSPTELLISDYVKDEFKQKLFQKWPDKAQNIYDIVMSLPFHFCSSSPNILGTLRDKKDIPVLSDAIFNKADIILTGDNDFLEAEIEHPKILSPAMMLERLGDME